eukprot:1158891-Pelagomonas_calceolata.AAC.2
MAFVVSSWKLMALNHAALDFGYTACSGECSGIPVAPHAVGVAGPPPQILMMDFLDTPCAVCWSLMKWSPFSCTGRWRLMSLQSLAREGKLAKNKLGKNVKCQKAVSAQRRDWCAPVVDLF